MRELVLNVMNIPQCSNIHYSLLLTDCFPVFGVVRIIFITFVIFQFLFPINQLFMRVECETDF